MPKLLVTYGSLCPTNRANKFPFIVTIFQMIQWSPTWLCILQLSSILPSTSPFVTAWPLLIPPSPAKDAALSKASETERPAPDSVSQAVPSSSLHSINRIVDLSATQVLSSLTDTPGFCIPGSKLMAWIVFDTT